MKITRVLLLIISMALCSSVPIVAITQERKTFTSKAKSAYRTFVDDMRCALNPKKKCNPEQKKRLRIAAVGLIIVVGTAVGLRVWLTKLRAERKWEREREEVLVLWEAVKKEARSLREKQLAGRHREVDDALLKSRQNIRSTAHRLGIPISEDQVTWLLSQAVDVAAKEILSEENYQLLKKKQLESLRSRNQ